MLTIDAHQHVWKLGESGYRWLTPAAGVLYRDFDMAAYRREAAAARVHASILVQADDDLRDTERMRALAEVDPTIVGVVAYAPLHRPREIGPLLRDFAADPLVVGVRNLTHDRAEGDWMSRSEFLDGVGEAAAAGLAIDLVGTRPEHFEAALAVTRAHPEARLVLDHLMKPPLGGDLTAWQRAIEAAATAPGVRAKLSGLAGGGPDPSAWTSAQVERAVRAALAAFGPARLLFGGDWPVVATAGGYARAIGALRSALADLPAPDAAQIWAGTAIEVYRLDPARLAEVPR